MYTLPYSFDVLPTSWVRKSLRKRCALFISVLRLCNYFSLEPEYIRKGLGKQPGKYANPAPDTYFANKPISDADSC